MNRSEISKLGGKATSRKKARAARANARQPRPGRTQFNSAVRFAVEWMKKPAVFDHYSEQMLRVELAKQFSLSIRRIEKVLTTAKTRV